MGPEPSRSEPFLSIWITSMGCVTIVFSALLLVTAVVGVTWSLIEAVPVHPLIKAAGIAVASMFVLATALALWLRK